MKKGIVVFILSVLCLFLTCNVSFAWQNGYSKRKLIQQKRFEKIIKLMKQWKHKDVSQRGLTDLEELGKLIYEDLNLSSGSNQACASCHNQSAKFADPDNVIAPVFRPVSQGSDGFSFGGRNAPTASYSGFSPKLHWNTVDELFIGGVFWDGRASGQLTTATATGDELEDTDPTGDPIADQAKGPFLNPIEMNLQTLEDVVNTVMTSDYRKDFLKMYGNEICEGYRPFRPNQCMNIDVPLAYNKIAIAIAAFERSPELNKFNSRFDMFVKEQGGDVSEFGVYVESDGFRTYVGPPAHFKSRFLTYDEADGLALFNADSDVQLKGSSDNVGGMCYLCHLTTPHDADYGENSTQAPGLYPPLLTDFSYDNLGIPQNPRVIELTSGDPDKKDLGLGGSDRGPELSIFAPDTGWELADEEGKFKVSTLRNIAETAPYGHNGYFPDLYSIVHFYNTRDVEGGDFFGKVDAEVPLTVNGDELGNLGLSFEQEKKLVLFLKTLTDR